MDHMRSLMKIKPIAACVLFLFSGQFVLAFTGSPEEGTQDSPLKPKRIYTTTRLITEKPVIDGVLDDAAWQTGNWAGDFTQWIPNEGAKPSHPTHLKILYDDENIYVGIRAFDGEPEKISRKLGRRDIFFGDIVGLNFDSYHDQRTGFEFNVTAAGQKIDLLLWNPLNWDVSWDAVWYAETAMEDSAWTAEFQIPLSQLRYSSGYEQVWGLHCWRWIDRLQEESDWEPQSSTGPGILFQFGELHGIKGLPKSRRFEVLPYSLGKVRTFKKETANPFADQGHSTVATAGLDVKIGLTNNFTADVTINPDFGQVEADPSEINLTAFETFFDEKRPFFLEGGNIFLLETDDANVFYSRRIGQTPTYMPDLLNQQYMKYPENTNILMATKISGKTADGLAVGILESVTASEHAEISSLRGIEKVEVKPLTNYFIGRLQQDFKAGNTVLGGIITATNRDVTATHLEFLSSNAYTAGLDFLHHWNDKEFYVDAKFLGSHITGSREAITSLQTASARYCQRPDAAYLDFDSTRTQLSGHGGSVEIGKKSKGLWRYSTAVRWHSPGLELNDLGFMQRSDFIKQENAISYFINRPVSIFRTYSIGLVQFNNWDYAPDHLSSSGQLKLRFEFLNKWTVSTSAAVSSGALDTRILRGGPGMRIPWHWNLTTSLQTDPSRRMSAFVNINTIRVTHKSGRFYSINPGVTLQPTNPLKIEVSLNYESNIDELQYTDTKSVNSTDRYILGKLNQKTLGLTFRVDYNFTPELSVQYYGSPFASVGAYSDFKSVTNPRADAYNERFTFIDVTPAGKDYRAEESYMFANPDFNFNQLRSNLVCRWEYRPGSQLYLVWSQDRTSFRQPGGDSVSKTLGNLRNVSANNIFLVKLSYWFSI